MKSILEELNQHPERFHHRDGKRIESIYGWPTAVIIGKNKMRVEVKYKSGEKHAQTFGVDGSWDESGFLSESHRDIIRK